MLHSTNLSSLPWFALRCRRRSIQLYFLFARGDVQDTFAEIADEELRRLKEQVDESRLEYLLELALRTTTAVSDPHKDNVR